MNGNAAVTAGANPAMMAAAANSASSYVSLIMVEPAVFEEVLVIQPEAPLVVYAEGGFFSKSYKFLTTYRGLGFYCTSPTMVHIPEDAQVIRAKRFNF